jgi:transcriptional regulator
MSAPKNLKLKILELRRQGKSYREIEDILDCTRSTISFHCKRHNVTDTGKKRHAISNDLKNAIHIFCKEHKTSEAIKYFNLSKSTIFKYKNFELKPDEQK